MTLHTTASQTPTSRRKINEWQRKPFWTRLSGGGHEIARGRDSLLIANRQLEQTNRDLNHFASVVAHDLKSPLSTISAMSTWLCEEYEGQLEPDAQEYLKFMSQAVRRMNTLVDAVLQYSKADADRQASVGQLDSGEILGWVVANLYSEVHVSHAVITSDPLPQIEANENELAQIFQNLIVNAIRYGKPGENPTIHVTAVESEHEWTFSVADNGIGIETEQTERIFNLFERLNPEGPGIGLGLSICRKVIEKRGGRIWVESEIGKGSTFRFTVLK